MALDEAVIVTSGEEFVLQIKIGDDRIALYRFDLQEQFLSDYELRNWYMSTHPNSLFVTELLVARPDIDRRYTLRNKTLTVRHLNGITERRSLDSIADLRATLAEVFRLTLPDTQDLEAPLGRVICRSVITCPPLQWARPLVTRTGSQGDFCLLAVTLGLG